MTPYFFYLLMLISLPLCADVSWRGEAPGGFSAEVTIPENKISIGQPIEIYLNLTYPKTYTFDLNSLTTHLVSRTPFKAPPFTLSSSNVDTKTENETNTSNIHFQLKSQLDGNFYLTFYAITFKPSNKGEPVQIASGLFPITVEQPPIETTLPTISKQVLLSLSMTPPIEINEKNRINLLENPSRDDKEIQRNEKIADETAIPWIEIVATILVGLLMLLAWLAPKYRPKPVAVEKIKLKARDKALQRLKTLQQQPPEPEKFYVELSDTVRHFIEEQYQMHAPTYTTQEFLQEATTHPVFSSQMQEELRTFLVNADKVKFAKHEPSESERWEAQESALRVITTE